MRVRGGLKNAHERVDDESIKQSAEDLDVARGRL
jgi:hypothetical protein